MLGKQNTLATRPNSCQFCDEERLKFSGGAMPFLGQDWRSPGEQWVRTSEGWERLRMWRLKLLENLNENVIAR